MNHFANAVRCGVLGVVLPCLCFGAGADLPGPSRQASPELRGDVNELRGLLDADYAKFTLEDTKLKLAYKAVFHSTIAGEFAGLPDYLQPAYRDLRRRGDAVVPMLLKLMDANQETGFEIHLLASISHVDTINVKPFTDYARRVLRDRTTSMSSALAGVSALLLSEHGDKDDLALLKEVIAKRPYVASSIMSELPLLEKRIAEAAKPASGEPPPQPALMPTVQPSPSKSPGAAPTPPLIEESTSPTQWAIGLGMIAAATGLLWWVLKRRAK